MKSASSHAGRRLAAVFGMFACCLATLAASPAYAARVGVLSDKFAVETAADFAAKISGHTFTGVDTFASVPTLGSLNS